MLAIINITSTKVRDNDVMGELQVNLRFLSYVAYWAFYNCIVNFSLWLNLQESMFSIANSSNYINVFFHGCICQAVAEMFAKAPQRTRFHNVRTVGLYGMGGIGKTTICKSLCNEYFAEFNGKVWHAELGKKGIEEIQKDVLRHLVGASESLLHQTVKCKDQVRGLYICMRMGSKLDLVVGTFVSNLLLTG